jgi:tetratricopeptide (TPR) repeat protein
MQQRLEEKRLEARALNLAQPDMTATHQSVAAAFELTWQDLDEPVRELAYRLSLYALAPIPWERIEAWYEDTDPDDLEDWRDEGLINRSLLTQVGENTVQLHQLIREFFRTKMEDYADADALKQGHCQGMVQIAQTIPETPTREQIVAVTPAIPHLAEAATTWQLWIENESLIWPFVGVGQFFQGQGVYKHAESWFQLCLDTIHNRLGHQSSDFAKSLNNLGINHYYQGRYESAETFLKQALDLRRQLLEEDNPEYAQSLNNLEMFYYEHDQYDLAEPLLIQSLELRQAIFGEMHLDVLESLNNLGRLYQAKGHYQDAKRLLQRVLTASQNLPERNHFDIARSLNNLGMLLLEMRQFENSASHLEEALNIRQQLLGELHPDFAQSLNNLGMLFNAQGHYKSAEALFEDALLI